MQGGGQQLQPVLDAVMQLSAQETLLLLQPRQGLGLIAQVLHQPGEQQQDHQGQQSGERKAGIGHRQREIGRDEQEDRQQDAEKAGVDRRAMVANQRDQQYGGEEQQERYRLHKVLRPPAPASAGEEN